MLATCQRLLEDGEVRVRWAVGELLRALCGVAGIAVWERTRGCLLESIHRNFDRDSAEPSGQLPDAGSGAGRCAAHAGWGGQLRRGHSRHAQKTLHGSLQRLAHPLCRHQRLVWVLKVGGICCPTTRRIVLPLSP
jgi:hypothetical protein